MIGKNRARWECHACGKVAYGSQARACETIHHFAGGGYVPVRAYQCEYGNGWHLTSQDDWSRS